MGHRLPKKHRRDATQKWALVRLGAAADRETGKRMADEILSLPKVAQPAAIAVMRKELYRPGVRMEVVGFVDPHDRKRRIRDEHGTVLRGERVHLYDLLLTAEELHAFAGFAPEQGTARDEQAVRN